MFYKVLKFNIKLTFMIFVNYKKTKINNFKPSNIETFKYLKRYTLSEKNYSFLRLL
jgi:hypothetical protein